MRSIASVGLVVAALLVGTSATAAAETATAAPASPAAESLHAQDLQNFNTWIVSSGTRTSGYVASIDDPATGSETVLWNGPKSSAMNQVLAEGAARGIKISVKSWPYSYSDLDAAAKRVMDDQSWLPDTGFTVTDVSALDGQFAGLTIEGTFDPGLTAGQRTALEDHITKAASNLTGKQMPVRVRDGVTAMPASGRDNPNSPYRGGSYMLSGNGQHTCSTGFTIRYDGATHTTTARHCDAAYYYARDNSSKQFAGGSFNRINPGAARWMGSHGTSQVFVGPWNTTSGRSVNGFRDLSVGDNVGTDGGNSGVHWGVRVTDLVVYWNDGYGTVSTIKGVRSAGVAAIQGDSGGPVIYPGANNTVWAAGMIQAIAGTLHTGSWCGPVRDAGSNLCSNTVLFTSMRTIVNGLPGSSLYTG